jgi:predicted dehydrogenase/nucleoside-diphosphate-sugar epimerase
MTAQSTAPRVGLIGAGYISAVHAEVLKALEYRVSAIVDPNRAAAADLARRFDVPGVFGSVEEALAAEAFDRAHVLVPPDRHHSVAVACLRAGKPALIEKPLCVSETECASLIEASTAAVPAGVNQNFVFHPAFLRLKRDVRERAYGKPQYVSVVYHGALRQLATRQFSHWMFREPRNLLLEQAVHPLSQLLALCGEVSEIRSIGEPSVEIAPDANFVGGFTAALTCGSIPASVRFSVGHPFPYWQMQVVCEDGVLVADMLANRYWRASRTRWLEPVDLFVSGHRTATSFALESWKNLLAYGLSMAKLKPRSDAFFLSMRNSIAAFHTALDRNAKIPLDATFGRDIVAICDRISSQGTPQTASSRTARPVTAAPLQSSDVAVLGGTGFIGTEVVRKLRSAGLTVTVLARNTINLPGLFLDGGVTVRRGDIRSRKDVSASVAGARYVINLAHGGGGATWEAIRDAMVGGAETIAHACLEAGTERLVHVSSIAALYLGPQAARITGATPPDPHFAMRADYARAKVMSELRLFEMHREQHLPVCILRPGLVVGEGTSPFHSGLGFFNNDQHCIGWNDGRNALPFVLVEDVADAICLSLQAKDIEGRSYNLVGGVRPTAREYIRDLARALERPLRFHPKSPYALYCEEMGKWVIKRATGRNVPPPSLRDLLSRGLKAGFDCSDVERDFGWRPARDEDTFLNRAIWVHAGK